MTEDAIKGVVDMVRVAERLATRYALPIAVAMELYLRVLAVSATETDASSTAGLILDGVAIEELVRRMSGARPN